MRLMLSLIAAIAPIFVASSGFAAPFIERDGRYEFNWTTGKVRFYGVSAASQDDENFRSAEQSAWADGLKSAERHLPVILANRLGKVEQVKVDRISKLAQSTISVSTTYFGDKRVKVLLEASLQKMTPQLVSVGNDGVSSVNDLTPVTIKLPKGAMPSAFVHIIDEHGRDMLRPSEIVAAAHAGAPLAKWYRHEASGTESALAVEQTVINAETSERGVIRVKSAEWKPAFASAVSHGKASFIVQ